MIAFFLSNDKTLTNNIENKKFIELIVEPNYTKNSKINPKIQKNIGGINSYHILSSRAVKGLFARNNKDTTLKESNYFGITNENAKEILFTPPKISKAFDLLAQKVNFYLEYPMLLIEEGITGNASLDLFFDKDGLVDENQSIFSGSNRYVRGLLVKATRDGLLKWYEADGFHLQVDEFRNQHFHVDFEISYTQENLSKYEKVVPNSYSFSRRHYRHECANPAGVDISCIAIKAYGAVDKAVSPAYKIRLATLKEQLEALDGMGVKNVNFLISKLKI